MRFVHFGDQYCLYRCVAPAKSRTDRRRRERWSFLGVKNTFTVSSQHYSGVRPLSLVEIAGDRWWP